MKVCFWGSIARALTGKTDGGSELQIALLAKALARAGHEVVCLDYQITGDFITPEGIKVLQIKGWYEGIRAIRLLTHRLPNLYSMLKEQKADIYYCRMRDFINLFPYRASRKVNGRFILAMASDLDASGLGMRLKYYYIPNMGETWWIFSGLFIEVIHPWLLRKADAVFVQHNGQKKILEDKGVKSVLFSNLFDLSKLPVFTGTEHNDFVYVGWLDKRKGFAEFFEVISKSPNHTFKIIGPPRDKTGHYYYEKLKSFPNVKLLGELSHAETLAHIASSKALVSTSPMEGFPNIFIEAWACGIPVLSLYFDPGDVIKREELGMVANGNIDALAKALDSVSYSEDFAKKARNYLERTHVLNDQKVEEISELFNIIKEKGKKGTTNL
jgi:glycosyltransferase involved in cell wall biosynthesis